MIIIVMGVSGSGKTTIGQLLAKELGWRFYEGDDFHPPANVQKMAQGTALTDEDRAPWLATLAELIKGLDREARSAVIACSVLKQAHRDILQGTSAPIRFVYLKGSRDLIGKRMEGRHGHYMKTGLLDSQFDILEEPHRAIVADIAQTPEMIANKVIRDLGL